MGTATANRPFGSFRHAPYQDRCHAVGCNRWYFDLNRYDPPEMLRLIDADLARKFAIVGTPEQCAAQMQELLDLGFDGVSCNLAAVNRDNMFEGLRETIEGSRSMLRLLR